MHCISKVVRNWIWNKFFKGLCERVALSIDSSGMGSNKHASARSSRGRLTSHCLVRQPFELKALVKVPPETLRCGEHPVTFLKESSPTKVMNRKIIFTSFDMTQGAKYYNGMKNPLGYYGTQRLTPGAGIETATCILLGRCFAAELLWACLSNANHISEHPVLH